MAPSDGGPQPDLNLVSAAVTQVRRWVAYAGLAVEVGALAGDVDPRPLAALNLGLRRALDALDVLDRVVAVELGKDGEQ